MHVSRFFIILLIPIIILALGIWFASTNELDRGSVQVAGAMMGAVEVDLTVKDCYMDEGGDARALVVEIEVRNTGVSNVSVNPLDFQLVLFKNEQVASSTAFKSVYRPISYASTCAEAPGTTARIPPDAVRSISLRFWGGSMPRGEGWKDYSASLEYYDPSAPLLLSKPVNPESR